MSAAFQALSSRNYRWYLTGQLVTASGTWMQRIAQDWLVLDITGGNATALGLATALQFIPFILITPFAGVLADRFSRRRIMQVTASVGAVTATLLAAIVISGNATVGWVYALAFVLGTAAAVDNPARQAMVARTVPPEHLANAIALNSATFNLSRILGPSLGGVIIAVWGVGQAFAVNAASFILAIVAVSMIRAATTSTEATKKATFRDGLAYVRARPDLIVVLAAVAVAATFAFNYAMFTALMAREQFNVSAAQFGIASSVLAVGSIVGSLVAARRRQPGLRRVLISGVAFGLATVAAGLQPNYTAFVAILPVAGFAALTFSVAAQSYLQLHAGDAFRGRVMGLYALVFFGGNPIGAPALGWVADTFGPRWTLIGGGLAAALGLAVVAWFARRFVGQQADRGSQTASSQPTDETDKQPVSAR